MKRILVPCDFSNLALEALKFAIAIADRNKAQVFVVKAIDLPISYESAFGVQPYTYDPGVLREFGEKAMRKFQKLKARYNTRNGKVHFQVEYGSVSTVIEDMTKKKRIDLIVMGTHGASGVSGFVVGSNTEKIVRRSSVPVFVIRKAVRLASIKNIVFASSLAASQQRLVSQVKTLQSFFHARLHIVFVNTPSTFIPTSVVNDAMDKYARQYKLKNYAFHIWNDYNESDGIMHFLVHSKANMLVLGTHGRRGLAHLLSGSVAEKVVNSLNLPIWTFRLKH